MNRFYQGDWMDSMASRFVDELPDKYIKKNNSFIDDENNDTIDIDDSLKLKLKFPSLDEFIKSNFETGSDDTVEASFDLIASCIDKIYNDEEIWEGKDSSKKELREFIDQLSSKQFKEIEKFFETMPKLSYTTKITNRNTIVESEVTLEGLASFFA